MPNSPLPSSPSPAEDGVAIDGPGGRQYRSALAKQVVQRTLAIPIPHGSRLIVGSRHALAIDGCHWFWQVRDLQDWVGPEVAQNRQGKWISSCWLSWQSFAIDTLHLSPLHFLASYKSQGATGDRHPRTGASEYMVSSVVLCTMLVRLGLYTAGGGNT